MILFAGPTAQDGASAYETAVANGYIGTEVQWLADLVGAPGASAYQIAVANGFTGTASQWLASLHGANGASAYALAVQQGYFGTVQQWLASLQGPAGAAAQMPELGLMQPWTINGPGSNNVAQTSGSYIKTGHQVTISGQFLITAVTANIALPFPPAFGVSQQPIGFVSMNAPNQGAYLSFNAGASTAFIGTVNITGGFPKQVMFSFTYMCV